MLNTSALQLSLIQEALQLSQFLLTRNSTTEADNKKQQQRLKQIRELLRERNLPICYSHNSVSSIPLDIRFNFAKAVLLLLRYPQLGGTNAKGTLLSSTLCQYFPDKLPQNLLASLSINDLCQLFEIPNNLQAELKKITADIDTRITQRKRLIQAVIANSDSAITLFKNLVGDIPLPKESLTYLYTETQIYFGISYQDEQLCDRMLWESISELDRTKLQAFFSSLNSFDFKQFQNFPVFNHCSKDQLDYQWCSQIASSTGLTSAFIIQQLPQSFGIIATDKTESFLVHDIWGHHWQSILTDFSDDYKTLANCDQPLRVGHTACTAAGLLAYRELFTVEGKQVKLDESRARLFFQAEVSRRLKLISTHVIAEILADVAEFKLICHNPTAASQLISSSVFKQEATKLDLTLNDLHFLFVRVLDPLLEIHSSITKSSTIEHELLTEWAVIGHPVESLELRTSLKQSIAHLNQTFLELYHNTCLPTLTEQTQVFFQIAIQLISLQNAINELYTTQSKAGELLPFQDLLLIFISCCYSSNPVLSEVSETLTSYFFPLCQILSNFAASNNYN